MASPEAPAGDRAMWLLNHSTLRRFDVDQLRRAGVTQVLAPKSFPFDERNLSADVDASLDATLDLDPDELALLNAQDWYACENADAWAVANARFRIAFIGFYPRQIESVVAHFDGTIVVRVLGLPGGGTYSAQMREHLSLRTRMRMQERAARLWFAGAHAALDEREDRLFADRFCHLPAGLAANAGGGWTGEDRRVLVMLPGIGVSQRARSALDRFKQRFGGLPHVVGGAQPIAVPDATLAQSRDDASALRALRVMYVPSRDAHAFDYAPFEAMVAGMPVVFPAEGLLDRFGGRTIPGRCRNDAQALRVLRRLLSDERAAAAMAAAQRPLLEAVSGEECAEQWQRGFARVARVAEGPVARADRFARGARIAVMLPIAHRGGTFRRAKLIAQALHAGSRQAGEDAEIVFAHLDEPGLYEASDFRDLPPAIGRRSFRWRTLSRDEAQRALAYAGVDARLDADSYAVPDDGATQFDDCDLWFLASDRLFVPLLPVKPYAVFVNDYVQRYEGGLDAPTHAAFVGAQHAAERVLVPTEFAYADARDFAGLPLRKLARVPLLAQPCPSTPAPAVDPQAVPYLVWATTSELRSNHDCAAAALRIYYEELDGRWLCKAGGLDIDDAALADVEHLKALRHERASSRRLRRSLAFLGELPDAAYRQLLSGARFVWHAGRDDGGTLAVVDAAHLGVPSLSSDYPAMREIAAATGVTMAWADPRDPEQMAAALKAMEVRADALRARLPSRERLAQCSVDSGARAYWAQVRACL